MNSNRFSDQSRRLARNFSWLTFQETLIRVIGLATAIYLARVLDPSDYGALGLALAIVSFAAVLVRSGTGSRATRQTARDPAAVPDIYADITGIRLVAAAVVIACLAGFAGTIAPAFSIPPALLILSSFLLLRPALTVAWAFRGLDQMQVNALSDVAEKILTFLGLLLLVRGVGNDVQWAPVVETAAALLIVVWLRRRLALRYRGLRIGFRVSRWPEIAREAGPISLAAMLGSVYLNGGVLLLGLFATAKSAAMFLVAQKVMLTLAILLQVVNKAAFPTASRLVQSDVVAALELATRLLRYYLFIIIPAFLVVAFHARDVLALLFGAGYAEAGPVLIVLLAALPFFAISNTLQLLLMALPRPMAVLASRLAGVVALLLLSAWLIPELGAVGAAFALVGGELTSSALQLVLVRRVTGGMPWDLRCFAPLVAGVAAASVYQAIFAWPLAAKLPLAGLIYTGVALLLKAVTLAELVSLPLLLRAAARSEPSADVRPDETGVQPNAEEQLKNQP